MLFSLADCSEDQKDVCEELTDLLKYAADNPPKSMVQLIHVLVMTSPAARCVIKMHCVDSAVHNRLLWGNSV